jgi:hypothetical protein
MIDENDFIEEYQSTFNKTEENENIINLLTAIAYVNVYRCNKWISFTSVSSKCDDYLKLINDNDNSDFIDEYFDIITIRINNVICYFLKENIKIYFTPGEGIRAAIGPFSRDRKGIDIFKQQIVDKYKLLSDNKYEYDAKFKFITQFFDRNSYSIWRAKKKIYNNDIFNKYWDDIQNYKQQISEIYKERNDNTDESRLQNIYSSLIEVTKLMLFERINCKIPSKRREFANDLIKIYNKQLKEFSSENSENTPEYKYENLMKEYITTVLKYINENWGSDNVEV